MAHFTTNAWTVRGFESRIALSQESLRERLAEAAVTSLIFLSIASPPAIVWDPNSFYLKWEVALLPVILFLYGWLLLAGVARSFRLNGMFAVATVYSVAVSLSTWYGATLLGQTVIFRDFYEIPKLWLPVVFFTLAYEAKLSEAALRRVLTFFSVALLLVCLYAWGQWAGMGFAYWLDHNLYAAGADREAVLQYARRVYSTMNNPNLLAQLLTWSFAAFWLATLHRAGNQARNVFMVLACLITIAMTGSRYGVLDTALVFLLTAGLSFTPGMRRVSKFGLFLGPALFALVVLLISASNQKTLERFQTLQNPFQTDSFRERADARWVDALDSFSQSPFLGRGPAKKAFDEIITDSEYLDVLKKFGLIGFFSYLAYFLFPLAVIWKGMRAAGRTAPGLEARSPATFVVLQLGFIIVLTSLVMNVGMSTFYNPVLPGLPFLWLGLAARAAKSIPGGPKLVPSPRNSYLHPERA